MSDNQVQLFTNEDNELSFDVVVEGTSQEPSITRIVIEAAGQKLMFDGEIKDGNISVKIPKQEFLKEGTYKSSLEVIVDGKYFVPILFESNFKKQAKVVLESKAITNKVQQKPVETVVKASITQQKKPAQQPQQKQNKPKENEMPAVKFDL